MTAFAGVFFPAQSKPFHCGILPQGILESFPEINLTLVQVRHMIHVADVEISSTMK